MAYEIPKIEGESSITWNNKVYWPVTEWTVSSGVNNGWLAAAVRFLMEEGATETSFHIVAQYTAWTRTGSIDRNNGYMLIRKLASEITTYTNDGGVQQQGSFFSRKNTNQRQGYVYNGVLTGSKIWYDTPYFMTEAWTTLNGDTSAGTVGDGVTVYSSTFYVGTTEVNAGVYLQTSINASYTTPLRTYEISYNANGGTGTTASQTKVRGTDIVLSANSFTRNNYHFVEWNTEADGSGTPYSEGQIYQTDADLTLYAIWAINYILPTYNNIQLYRVNQDGEMDDYGDYVELFFDYVFGGNKFSTGTVHVQYQQVGSTNWTDLTTWTQSNTITSASGSWDACTYVSSSSKVSFSTDVAWEFQLWLTDNTTDGETYNSTIYNTVLTIALFPLDIYGGTSLAVGTPAPETLPASTDADPSVGGLFTLGKSWDMNMPLDTTNAIDNDLNTAIIDAGISDDVFHNTGGLSLKMLLAKLATAPTCIERSGGQGKEQFYGPNATWPSGYGWEEEKWTDGRLTVRWWDWWGVNSGTDVTRTVTNEWPAETTDFIDVPSVIASVITNPTQQTAVSVTINQVNANSQIICTLYKRTGVYTHTFVMFECKGHWK